MNAGGPHMRRKRDLTLKIARAIVGCTSQFSAVTSKQIQAARHMAHDGATAQEIVSALGWAVDVRTAARWLKRLNIRPALEKRSRPHLGESNYLPKSHGQVSMRSYRPRVLA